MYSAFELPGRHARALQLGAAGYVSKTADLDTLLSAIRRVASGGTWFPPHVLIGARRAPRRPTDREAAIIRLVVDGASNVEIAGDLGITVKTVEGVLRRLFDRYDVRNRTELARLTQRQGWLPTTVEAVPGGEDPR
jgi:DNA-binding NarL/FixJ family response regulator